MKLNNLKYALIFIFLTQLYAVPQTNLRAIQVDYIHFADVTLKNLFTYIGSKYGVNFFIEPKYEHNKISVHLNDITLEELLEIVCLQNSLTYKNEGSSIYISSLKNMHTKNYLDTSFIDESVVIEYAALADVMRFLYDTMPGQAIIRSTTTNDPYQNLYNSDPKLTIPTMTQSTQTATTQDEKVFPKLDKTESTTSQTQKNTSWDGNAVIDYNVPKDVLYIVPFFNENRLYLFSSSQKLIDRAKKLVAQIDVPLKQVLIQGQVFEVALTDGFTSNFDFTQVGSGLTNTISSVATVGNLKYTFFDSKFAATIEIAKTEGRAKTISSPMLLTMNRVSATLNLTEEITMVTGAEAGKIVQGTDGTSNIVVNATPTYTKKDIGTLFTITPFINKNNEILLKLDISISAKSGNTQTIQVPDADGIPQDYEIEGVSVSQIKTTLTTADKQGIVLGGIIRDSVVKSDSKVPILGDIPFLGIPFKQTKDTVKKSELIVVLTPIIVDLKNPQKEVVRQELYHSLGKEKSFNAQIAEDATKGLTSKPSGDDDTIKNFLEDSP